MCTIQLNGSAPVSAAFPPSLLGATSEAFADALTAYASANPDHALLPSTSTSEAADGGEQPYGSGYGDVHLVSCA